MELVGRSSLLGEAGVRSRGAEFSFPDREQSIFFFLLETHCFLQLKMWPPRESQDFRTLVLRDWAVARVSQRKLPRCSPRTVDGSGIMLTVRTH